MALVSFQKKGESTKSKTKVCLSRTETGDIDKVKGDTQEEELIEGEVGYKKSSDSSEKREQVRDSCNLNQW